MEFIFFLFYCVIAHYRSMCYYFIKRISKYKLISERAKQLNIVYEKMRIGIDKAVLGAKYAANKLSGGKIAKSMFTAAVNVENINTRVRIISEDEDSVTIAKTDSNGKIVNDGFKILSTTDLHFGDDPALRNKCVDMLYKQIRDSKADFVVLTGDIILGKYQHIDAIQFAQFMEKIGVYWCFTFGNHEAREEKGRFKELLMKCKTTFPHCLARQGKKELFGLCNYCVNILKSENEILKTLFMFDSGRNILPEYRAEHGVPEDLKGYDFLKNNQMNWYKNKIKSLSEKYGEVKSFMYMHIPLPEYENVITQNEKEEWVFTGKCEVLYGNAFESVGCSSFNSGMFDLIKKLGSTQAVFSGHDHVNDFCALHEGVYLVYNQCGGYETYTMEEIAHLPEKAWQQGSTITCIESDGKFTISQRLNSMYL